MEQHIRVGIITTPEGESSFASVLNEFGNVIARLMLYNREEDISEIIKQNQADLDVILFGGPLSYHMNRKYVHENIPTLCVEYKESELMKGLVQAREIDKKQLKKISLDTFRSQIVKEVFHELELPMRDIYVKEFQSEEQPSEIVDFHWQLWQQGKIDFVITCRRSVYLTLLEKGIPVRKVLPTKFNIRESLTKAVLLGENSKNVNFQIAVGILTLDIDAKEKTEYDLEKANLDFHRMLVDLAQTVDASIIPLRPFEILLYTNRGFLEEITHMWTETSFIKKIEDSLSAKVSAGFGAGRTALSAQLHAKQALEQARSQGGGCAYLIRDDGKILGPLGKGTALEYQHKSNDPVIKKMAEKTRLGIDTVSKTYAFSNKQNQFTAEDLAHALGVTTRNTRNIIKRLWEAGYLTEIGIERPYPKGRPRKIYMFDIKALLP